ncbi:MAG TPA: hypothetical protein VGH82_15470 [Gaiellaceae bacterium]
MVALVAAGTARAGDGGSATYTTRGTVYDFDLENAGTTRWLSFVLVGPAGTAFIGGSVGTEATVQCVVGPPASMVCGPTAVAVGGQLGFTAFLQAAVPCGSPFQLWVSSTGAAPYTRVGDAVFAGSCAPPRVVRSAVVRRRGGVVTLIPPTWSATPVRVVYQWQQCTPGCKAIPHATSVRVHARARVRAIVVATFADGVQLRSVSRTV